MQVPQHNPSKEDNNGWPSFTRPDHKTPGSWSHELIISINRPRTHVPSPNGAQIAFFWDRDDRSDLYVMPTTGGWPQQLTFGRPPLPYWFDDPPQWSPDGHWIAYTHNSQIWIIPPSGGQPRSITPFSTAAGSPRWMPDSKYLLLTHDEGEYTNLLMTDLKGSWPKVITPLVGRDQSPQPSPDRKFVVFARRPLDDLDRMDIILTDLDDSYHKTLVGLPGVENLSPQWSPDGKQIAYISNRTNYFEIFLYDLESGNEQQLTNAGFDLADIAWSPDGTKLIFTVNRSGAFHLGMFSLADFSFINLNTRNGFHARPRWLPDGKSITFEYDDPTQPADIYKINLETSQIGQLTFSTPPIFDHLSLCVPKNVSYTSLDGLEIPAFLYLPHQPNGAGIVYPHGGPTAQYALEWDPWVQYMVAKGYALLAPNFRGSTGYGRDFQRANYGVWGVKDTEDCLAAADFLGAIDYVNPERMGIFGASYGGYLAICALAFDPQQRFACGVTKYGDCNLLTSWAECDRSGHEDLYRMMGHPADNLAAYRAGSPIWKVADIQSPLLIFHGLQDPYVPPNQSEELVQALKHAGKTFEYRTYPDEGHGILLRRNQLDFYARMERFLDWYLL